MRKVMIGLAWTTAVILAAIAFVRWGGEPTREAVSSRAETALTVLGIIAFVASLVAIQARKNR